MEAPGNPTFDTWTYKIGGQWEPGYGLKIRGNYARAVRAPNISELFAPIATGLTNLGTDPCAGAAPVTNADLRAVCIAQGAPAFAIGSITQPIAGQANATTGGNLNLGPEKADTYTVGIVFQPEFVSGLSLTVDYFNIKIKKAITIPTPGDVISLCFDNLTAASATDPNCTSIGRDPNTGNLNGDPATTTGLPLALTNLGTHTGEGVDLTVNYTRDLGFANLALGLLVPTTRMENSRRRRRRSTANASASIRSTASRSSRSSSSLSARRCRSGTPSMCRCCGASSTQ